MADGESQGSEVEEPELIVSKADELTHAELLCMYKDSEENIRFAKLTQWRATGGTLAIFIALALLTNRYPQSGDMTKILTILTFLVGAFSLSMLTILQSWQGTERQKIKLIISRLSSLARDVYNTKPRLVANVERYVLLCIMCGAVVAGGYLTLCQLMQWFSS